MVFPRTANVCVCVCEGSQGSICNLEAVRIISITHAIFNLTAENYPTYIICVFFLLSHDAT